MLLIVTAASRGGKSTAEIQATTAPVEVPLPRPGWQSRGWRTAKILPCGRRWSRPHRRSDGVFAMARALAEALA